MKLKLFLSLIISVSFFFHVHAQKFGHINSALLIEQHPKVALANTQLESFQKIVSDSFALKVKAFEDKYKLFLQDANSGTLSQVVTETRQNELKAEQQALATEEQQVKFRILQKREALLQPILTEIDSIIQAVGKEGKYTMIFDTSVGGALLFAEPGEDITELVKTRCK